MTFLDEPSPLFDPLTWLFFCPRMDQTWDENVNALSLLVLYVGILLSLYKRDGKYVLGGLIFMFGVLLAERTFFRPSNPSAELSNTNADSETFREADAPAVQPSPVNPSKFDLPFEVDPAFQRSRHFVPRGRLSDADQTDFAKSLFGDGITRRDLQQNRS